MFDSVLDLLVVLLPFALSVVGVWTFEPLREHKGKWRVGLILIGAAFSLLTFVQQSRQRAKAASDARGFLEQAVHQDRESKERFDDLTSKFNAFVAESLRRERSAAIIPKGPSAEEIAAEVDRRLSARLQPPPTNPPADKPPLVTKSIPSVPPPVEPIIHHCRDDRLSECSDEQLLENLKPLVASILAIQDEYSADTKKLDDIKGGKLDWLRFLTGIGADKDSKWLKGFELANRKATEHFRDCCAERALVYQKELLQRDHQRSDDTGLYEWVQNLLKPINSKQWKKARDEGDKVGNVYFDLKFFQNYLEYAVDIAKIHNPKP